MQQLQHNKYKIAHYCNKKCYFNKIPKKTVGRTSRSPPLPLLRTSIKLYILHCTYIVFILLSGLTHCFLTKSRFNHNVDCCFHLNDVTIVICTVVDGCSYLDGGRFVIYNLLSAGNERQLTGSCIDAELACVGLRCIYLEFKRQLSLSKS